MARQLERSLKALRTDRIDIYQVHGVSQQTFQDDELWSELERQKQNGKIRHIGVSIHFDADVLRRDCIETAQVHYNLLDRDAEKEVLPFCLDQNVGVLARVPLAGGFLSGKYRPGKRWNKNDVRTRSEAQQIDERLSEVDRIMKNEVPPDVPISTWALRWCLAHPAVSAVIPGCKSVGQLQTNAAAAEDLIEMR